MNKNEINSKIEDLKYEIKKLEQLVNKPEVDKEKEMSDFLFSMLNKTIREMTDERIITHYRASDNEWLFQQDYKNGYLWVRYSLIWNVFENKFGLNYEQIRDFISAWVEKNTKWSGITPVARFVARFFQVEKNTKWSGITPHQALALKIS